MICAIEDQKKYPNISKQQSRILDYMNMYLKDNGYPPTVREICAAVGLSSTSTVHSHLKKLEKEGYIKKKESKPRAIGITNPNSEEDEISNNSVSIPLVGEVAAGTPILAAENIEEYLTMPKSMFPGDDYFMLKVRGDSMINAGIFDKDYVIVKSQSTAYDGDIVVALLDDSATVKTFYMERNYIRLQPENSSMSPILVDKVDIQGIVKGIFRLTN